MPLPSSPSIVVGEGIGLLSVGGKAEVGEGAISFFERLLTKPLKLGVFQGNDEVLGRDCWGSSRDGVVGCEPANDTEGSENFRFGCISCSQPEEGRRTARGYVPGACRTGTATCSRSSSLDAKTSLSGVGRRSCNFDLSRAEPPTDRPPLYVLELMMNGLPQIH